MKALFLAMLAGCFGAEMVSPAFSVEGSQHDPRRLTVTTEPTQGTSFWVKLAYQIPGGPDSVVTSVRQGTSRLEHRLTAVTRDSFALSKPTAGTTVTGQGCVQSKRRGLLSNEVCAGWTFTSPVADVPPPDPILDTVRTDTTPTQPPPPSAGVLFTDTFANGQRAGSQNGVRWTGPNGGSQDSVEVRSSTTSPSGYALRFFFGGNTSLSDDAFAEQNGELPGTWKEVFFCLWYRVPLNYQHRQVSPANNKGLRVYGGLTATAGRDSAYQHSALKAGYSTNPYLTGQTFPATGETSKLWPEHGMGEANTGNFGTGGHVPWFRPGTLERVGFYAKAGTFTRPATAADQTSNSLAGDGIIRIWRNGVLQYDRNNLAMFTAGAPNTFRYFYLLGWANSGFTQNTVIDLERVEIGQQPTTHCITP